MLIKFADAATNKNISKTFTLFLTFAIEKIRLFYVAGQLNISHRP